MNDDNIRKIGILMIAVAVIGIGYMLYDQSRGVSMAEAERISERYLGSLGSSELEISEIMEFEYNYYVIYSEESTGIGAFEMLIDKNTGQIFPEYGPNMMWNLKYGHGGRMGSPRDMMGNYYPPGYIGDLVTEEESLMIAQGFLDEVYPGSEADDPHPFYGYYTIHTKRDGEVFGMLSVNSIDGSVWYHNWHGAFIQSVEKH